MDRSAGHLSAGFELRSYDVKNIRQSPRQTGTTLRKRRNVALTDMASGGTDGIGTRTLRGMFWAYGSYVGGRLLSLVATAILARLLVPRDFGIVALALTFMAFLDLVQGAGVSQALVIGDEESLDERAQTGFVLNSVIGLALAGFAAALGPVAAGFFHQPRLAAVASVLGLNFVFLGLGATHAGLAQRSIDFRSRTVAELAEVIVRGFISVILALAGAGVWSLVIGYVVGTAAWTAALWILVPWRPQLRAPRQHAGTMLRFGGALTGVAVAGAFMAEFDNIVVGRVLGPVQLGYYSIATRLPMLVILNLSVVAGRVLFPAFASLDQRGELNRGLLAALRYTLIVTLPVTAFMIVFSEPLTVAAFGHQWRAAAGAMQVLCLWALMTTLGMIWGNGLQARARPGILLKLAIPQVAALVIGSLVFVNQGIVAVSWVQVTIAIAAQIAVVVVARGVFGLTAGAVLRAIAPPLLAAAVLAVALLVVHDLIAEPWPAIIVGGSVGALIYSALLLLLAPDTLRRLRELAFATSGRADIEVDPLTRAIDPIRAVDPLHEPGEAP